MSKSESPAFIYFKVRRQQALLNLLLDLGFQLMDRDAWNIKAEGSTEAFDRRNKDYPLDMPFLISVPDNADRETSEYFDSNNVTCYRLAPNLYPSPRVFS